MSFPFNSNPYFPYQQDTSVYNLNFPYQQDPSVYNPNFPYQQGPDVYVEQKHRQGSNIYIQPNVLPSTRHDLFTGRQINRFSEPILGQSIGRGNTLIIDGFNLIGCINNDQQIVGVDRLAALHEAVRIIRLSLPDHFGKIVIVIKNCINKQFLAAAATQLIYLKDKSNVNDVNIWPWLNKSLFASQAGIMDPSIPSIVHLAGNIALQFNVDICIAHDDTFINQYGLHHLHGRDDLLLMMLAKTEKSIGKVLVASRDQFRDAQFFGEIPKFYYYRTSGKGVIRLLIDPSDIFIGYLRTESNFSLCTFKMADNIRRVRAEKGKFVCYGDDSRKIIPLFTN